MGCGTSKSAAHHGQEPASHRPSSDPASASGSGGGLQLAPSLRAHSRENELVATGAGSFILSRADAEAAASGDAAPGSLLSSSLSSSAASGAGAAAHPSSSAGGAGSAAAGEQSFSSSSSSTSSADASGTMVVTKGGSYVIGRKHAVAWEPGTPIERPANYTAARAAFLPLNDAKTKYLRLSYSCYSEQGKSPKPPVKPNQDSFVAIERLGDDDSMALFGVFDGHGPKGEDASNFCRLTIPELTVRSPAFREKPFEALRASFEATHKRFISPEVSRLPNVDTAVSGSTAIAVMFHKDLLTCANVGDSRAMIGTYNSQTSGIVARPLSIDHKPNRPDEKARLLQASGRILSERQLGIEGGDADKFYVCRLHGGTIRYGVLFTRSIGDADGHAHLGLSSQPEVKAGRLDQRDRFVVLATDGVWDYLREEDVAALVMEAKGDAHLATLNVVQTAKACWDNTNSSSGGNGGNNRRDDITAIVILLSFVGREEKERETAAAVASASAASSSSASSSSISQAAAVASAAAPPIPAPAPLAVGGGTVSVSATEADTDGDVVISTEPSAVAAVDVAIAPALATATLPPAPPPAPLVPPTDGAGAGSRNSSSGSTGSLAPPGFIASGSTTSVASS